MYIYIYINMYIYIYIYIYTHICVCICAFMFFIFRFCSRFPLFRKPLSLVFCFFLKKKIPPPLLPSPIFFPCLPCRGSSLAPKIKFPLQKRIQFTNKCSAVLRPRSRSLLMDTSDVPLHRSTSPAPRGLQMFCGDSIPQPSRQYGRRWRFLRVSFLIEL